MIFLTMLLVLATSQFTLSHPLQLKHRQTDQRLSNITYGPIPSESTTYSDYRGKSPPFPFDRRGPILNTTYGPPGPDDLLFQNLLSAEYIVTALYQQAVEKFGSSSFTKLGFPNTTYDRITEIRDNEVGHLRIFQDQISSNSIKPGPCTYDFGFTTAIEWLGIQNIIEIGSMAFLTGLVLQAEKDVSKGGLVGIATVEARHLTWSLIDIWNADPFAGPIDTTFPYANQLLYSLSEFIVPGSCPTANPPYPYPSQKLPQIEISKETPLPYPIGGAHIKLDYTNVTHVPHFCPDKEYYAVFNHGLLNISVPFDVKTQSTVIPKEFEDKGLLLAVISDEKGAPTEDSVLAGPVLILATPKELVNV